MKKNPLSIVVIFCGFLAMMTLGLLFLPKRDFSAMENRYLAQLPEIRWESVRDGSFMTDFESWVSDHVPLRDQWVGLHAALERLSGKLENGGVYFGSEDTLLNRVEDPDPERVSQNIGYINTFVEQCPVPVWFGLIPTSSELWADRLPADAPTASEEAWIRSCNDLCDALPLDVYTSLKNHAGEDIFYRTDHHWTTQGAFYAANGIFRTMGLPELNREDYAPDVVSEDFRGTLWSCAGAWWTEPDTIEVWVPEEGRSVIDWNGLTPQPGELYQQKFLTEKDQYSFFLGGNKPLCVIETPSEGGKLLVIRDSYCDALAPFLTERFSQIHLIDLRYYKMNVLNYIEENEIDFVVILYGFSDFIEDRNLVFLSRSNSA